MLLPSPQRQGKRAGECHHPLYYDSVGSARRLCLMPRRGRGDAHSADAAFSGSDDVAKGRQAVRPRWPSLILAIICVLVGGVWMLQGAGLLAGSPMTGRTLWLVIGAILLVIGLVLGYRSLPGRAHRM